MGAAIAEDKNDLCHRELQKHGSENKKKKRRSRKGLRLIDPELNERGREKKKRDDEVLRRLRMLPAENEEGETGDKTGEDEHLDVDGIFQTPQKLVARPATAGLFRSETPPDELITF